MGGISIGQAFLTDEAMFIVSDTKYYLCQPLGFLHMTCSLINCKKEVQIGFCVCSTFSTALMFCQCGWALSSPPSSSPERVKANCTGSAFKQYDHQDVAIKRLWGSFFFFFTESPCEPMLLLLNDSIFVGYKAGLIFFVLAHIPHLQDV